MTQWARWAQWRAAGGSRDSGQTIYSIYNISTQYLQPVLDSAIMVRVGFRARVSRQSRGGLLSTINIGNLQVHKHRYVCIIAQYVIHIIIYLWSLFSRY